MTRIGATVFTLAILGLVSPTFAASAPTLSGGRDVFSVSDCAAPIPLRVISDGKPSAIRTGDLAPRPAASPPGWTIEWDKPTATDATINEYASVGHIKEGCPALGLFGVPITIYFEDHSTATLGVTLIRIADPVLDIPSSVTLGAEVVWTAPEPVALLLRETVPGAPETRVSILGGELKTSSGESTGIALEPGMPSAMVKSGETARVLLAPSQPPAPGLYTAKLGVAGPAVKAGTTIDVTYKVRVTAFYLLGTLALGIVLGLVVNVYLAKRAALDAALLAGLRAMQALIRRATPQRDPVVQQQLLAVASLLQSKIEDSATPEEVATHVTEAETSAKEIETRATEAATSLQQALTSARGLFRPAGHDLDPMLAERLDEPLGDLDRLQREADGGEIQQVTARLQDYNRDLPARVLPIVRGFLADARADLQSLGPLPNDAALAARRDALRQSIDDLHGPQDLAVMIKAANAVAEDIRQWIDLVAPDAMQRVWLQAARTVSGLPALSQRLSAAAGEAAQLDRAARDPLERIGRLGQLATQMTAAMTDADPRNVAAGNALLQGDFLGAARALAGHSPPGQVEMTLEPQAAVEHAELPQSRALVLAEAGPAAVLRIKSLVPLDQDSTVVVRWLGATPPADQIAWKCHPADAAVIEPVTTGAIVRPSKAGFLAIFLELNQTRIADVQTYVGDVVEEDLYAMFARESRIVGIVITASTALLTAVAGYEIFVPSWYGTVGDFFGAFLWGFFGQFGLDRIRDLAKPLLSKALPT